MNGISVGKAKGVGDMVQFTSLPENYFKATGAKLLDVDNAWVFDHNPYVTRERDGRKLNRVQDMWNFSPMKYEWPLPPDGRPLVYQSNAEIWALLWNVKPTLIRPRLYQFEDFPFEKREKILFHIDGKSHGRMPEHIVQHVLNKYGPTGQLTLIGRPDQTYGLPTIQTETLWDLAKVISEARMLIGCDSGPSWIAACYPDVVVKKVRTRPAVDRFDDWTPLNVKNNHAHWDDRIFQIFNPGETDVGPFQSYRRM